MMHTSQSCFCTFHTSLLFTSPRVALPPSPCWKSC